jgi:hypothetical protein
MLHHFLFLQHNQYDASARVDCATYNPPSRYNFEASGYVKIVYILQVLKIKLRQKVRFV